MLAEEFRDIRRLPPTPRHDRADTQPDRDQPERLDNAERLADERAAHRERLRQFPLARQPRAIGIGAFADQIGDPIHNLIGEPMLLERSEPNRRHAIIAFACLGLVVRPRPN